MSTLRVLDKDGNWVDIPTIVGPVGPVGPTGETGPGVSSGGSAGQILRKKSGDDFDTEWVTPTDMDLYYTKEEADDLINSKISTTFKYKGTKASYAEIQAVTNPAVGDVWNDSSTDHNYVWNGSAWDKLAGTVDMSNYYTKDEAEDMVGKKLTAVPIYDLLHFKGHVDTINDLPSLGQISATYATPNLNINQSNYNYLTNGDISLKSNINSYITATAAKYYIASITNDSYKTRRFVGTNHPEIIDGFSFYFSSAVSSSSTSISGIFIHVNASADKPAFLRCSGDLSANYTGITYEDGTGGAINSGTITRPFWYQLNNFFYSSCNLLSNLPTPIKFKIPPFDQFWYCDDWRGTSSQKAWYKPTTVTAVPIEGGFTYADGMYMIKANVETEQLEFIGSGSIAKVNDVYTVGSMKELYRCNERPEWEKLSDFKEFSTTAMTEADYIELEDKSGFDLYVLDRVAEITDTTNLLLNSITGDVDLVEANISEEEALAITDEIIGGVSDE